MDESIQIAEAHPQEEQKQEAKRELIELIRFAVLFLLVFWLIKSFVIEGYEVQGESMAPTLNDRDRILVLKLPKAMSRVLPASLFDAFQEGDIVIFDGVEQKRYVKRVVARNPQRHGKTVDAQHLDGESSTPVKVEFDRGAVRVNNWQIDESAYLPAENRETRDHDLCLLNPGDYYVLGDHRQISKDSRSFSAIRHEQIVGRAMLRFWPLRKFGLIR